jgi:predicted outer membrane repeat protein
MKIKVLIVILCSALPVLLLARPALATIYMVNSTLDLPDDNTGDGVCATASPGSVCTLRAAVMQANAHTGPDYITIPAGTYVLTRVGVDATAVLGDLDITDDLIIEGSGGSTIIDANGAVTADRAFEVPADKSLTLQSMTIQSGNTSGAGGAIDTLGNLQLINVTIQNNTATQGGGGIHASGTGVIDISSSTIRNNATQNDGGGVEMVGSGPLFPSLNIANSLIENNRSLNWGGGLRVLETGASIQNTSLRNNTAWRGGGLSYLSSDVGLRLDMTHTLVISNSSVDLVGGLLLSGNTRLSNSQIISNAGAEAGGVQVMGGDHLWLDVTISANTANLCGGVAVDSGNLNLNHSRVENNVAQYSGGGLCKRYISTVHMTDTVVLNNHAMQGGGILSSGANGFFAARSAIYQNSATRGGGVYVNPGGLAIFEDSTVSSNDALSDGGGLYADNNSDVWLYSVTVANNDANLSFPSAGAGGGIYISATAVVSVANTLIGGNTNVLGFNAPSDCFGPLNSKGYNFIGSNAGCTITGDSVGNQIGGVYPNNLDPMIAPLSWLTGLTPGHLPLAGSPLINAAWPSGCQSVQGPPMPVDQIGHNRTLDGRCDIGAIEYFDLQRVYLPLAKK